MSKGKNFGGRLDQIERRLPQGGVICVLDTPENRALVAEGYAPTTPQLQEVEQATRNHKKQHDGRRRLGKREIVVFLSEVEMAV